MRIFNSKDYMAGKCTHHEYYKQFVNDRVLAIVKRYIGMDAIDRSTDEHMNDIPLKKWNELHQIRYAINGPLWIECNNAIYANNAGGRFLWTVADQVCIAKAAARILKAKAEGDNRRNTGRTR